MKPIDDFNLWLKKITSKDAELFLTSDEKFLWKDISNADKERYIEELINKPILFENPEIIYDWYFRNKWGDALKAVCDGESISIFEIGAGGCDIIPKALSFLYNHPDTKYMTANLNKELTECFKWKTEKLPITIEVIEDDASNVEKYVGAEVFDVIAFEHSVNDVIETILAAKNDIDTVNSNWMDILPQITGIVNVEYANGTLKNNVKTEFLELIEICMNVLKPGGFIICVHYQFQYNLDIGLDPQFNETLMDVVRGWIAESGIGCEVFFENFDSSWWMFIKKAEKM